MTVVDGDLGTLVAGALVQIGRLAARSDARGVASIPIGPRSALVTVASKPGYGARAVRLPFRTHPRSTMKIYRRALQWAMYGAVPERTQQQAAIRLRPPFKVVWTHGLGGLIEFPAVVADGVAYIGNARETIRALDMQDGSVIWRHDTSHGEMASSPAVFGGVLVVHGMDGTVQVLRRSDGHLLWRFDAGSPIESSPVVLPDGVDVFGTWDGWVTALDLRTHRVRWRYRDGCKITSSAAVADGTVYVGDYCGRLIALSTATGALRWAGSVNGRVYGTPAVAGGSRLRAELDGWIADRLLHPRRTSLGQVDRLVRLLLAGRGRRPRLLRLLQRRLLRALGPVGVDALGTRHRRADLRCGRRRRRDRVRGLVRAPDPGCRCRDRKGGARLPARGVRAGGRRRPHAAAARLLTALRGRAAVTRIDGLAERRG